jgi:DNA mismatch repair protein MutS2
MDEATARILEFGKIRDLLAGVTVTAPGAELARALHPLPGREAVAQALAQTAEMCRLLEDRGRPPLGGSADLRPLLRELDLEGAFLAPEDLLAVLFSLDATADCRRYFSAEQVAPRLFELSRGLQVPSGLRDALRSSIGERGEILDGASFALGDLRRQIRTARERLRRTLENMLNDERYAGVFQEHLITERGGRYVLPVKVEHKGRVKGFVHDESSSGQTLYVEPASTLADNNHLQSLLREEKREEERILRRLSDGVRLEHDLLLANQELLALLDLRAAVARFSQRTDAVVPTLSTEAEISLRQARHPLLLMTAHGSDRDEPAVPIDLLLGAGADSLIISGPNTGGKTVALKTLGLLCLMVRCGLPVPCHPDSRIYLFEPVFADIGDEQSIERNLSTFSGHLARLRFILEQAGDRSLVLLDELGTGTDPAEGGALAMAVLDDLRRKGAKTVATTHLNLVKGYAVLNEGVENAAVEFDRTTLRPTYRLHYGVPGASNAFTIARTLGFPDEVLNRAEQYLGGGEREGMEVLEELNRRSRHLEHDLEEARRLKDRARQEREKRKRLLDEIEERRQAILDKAARRGEDVVRRAEARVRKLLKEAESLPGSPADAARVTREVRQVREDVARSAAPAVPRGRAPRQVRIGELVRIPALGAEAEVARVNGEQVELLLHGKKMRLSLSELEAYQPSRFAHRQKGVAGVRSRVQRETVQPRLKLVGERVDEALPRLERFIDDAVLQGLREIEVIHGAGEGILRRAMREYLAACRVVQAFHDADLAQGGDKVTVVQLRES